MTTSGDTTVDWQTPMTTVSFAVALVVLLVSGESSLAADRPRVIETVPTTSDAMVRPDVKELRVVFDQPMATNGGYSFVGGGPQFPEIAGKPKWESETTVVLPIKLKADHEYRLSINSDRYRNFRGTNELPAVPFPISFSTLPHESSVELTPEQNRAAVTQLRGAIALSYSHRDLRGIDWDEEFAKFELRLIEAGTLNAFARTAAEMLAVAKDVHIWITEGGQTLATFRRKVRPNVNLKLLQTAVPDFQKINSNVATGRYPDGPAYLMIASWDRRHAEHLRAAGEFIDQLSAGESLVIDMRLNSGGDEILAREVAGRFVSEPVIYAKNKYRDPDADDGVSGVFDRALSPTPDVPQFRGSVVVLMGPVNMSSCEAFLLMMKQAPNVTLIGEQSYGSSGNPKPIKLANGVTVYLPSWVAMDATGVQFEGNGIEPDQVVDFTSVGDTDPIIDAALEHFRKRRVTE